MSRSNTVLLAAVIGLAVLYPVERSSHAQTSPEQANSEPKQDAKPIDLSPIANEIKGLTRAVESVKPEGKSADEIQREKDDLKAQQDMARWARLMAMITALGVAVTVAATIYVAKTLRETRRMVVEAEKTTKAAEETIAVTRDMARDQSRAYVHAKLAEIFWIDEYAGVSLTFKVENTGQTPVKWYGFRCHATLNDIRHDAPFPISTIRSRPLARWSYLPNGETVVAKVQDPLVLKELVSAREAQCAFRLDGIIFYETFFGEEFETEFSFFTEYTIDNPLAFDKKTGKYRPVPDKLKAMPGTYRTYERVRDESKKIAST